MSDVKEFKVEVSLDATISIKTGDGEFNWIKPGVSAAVTWSDIPELADLVDSVKFLTTGVTEPVLADIIEASNERLKEIHR